MTMPSLRFENPELQSRFLHRLKRLPFEVQLDSEGSVVCGEKQWPDVNGVANTVRDECFKWYFSWCDTPDAAKELEEHLRTNGLRYELERHEDRLVFLLPQSDMAKHQRSDRYDGPRNCSFCGKSYFERQRFFVTGKHAICDECVKELHAEIQSYPQ